MAVRQKIGNAGLRVEAALATVVHKTPGSLERVARYLAGLNEPTDDLLRWRLGTVDESARSGDWVLVPGHPGARIHPKTWGRVVLSARAGTLAHGIEKGGRPAVAYHEGQESLVLVGVQELGNPDPNLGFLRRTNRDGTPDPDGTFVSTVMRVGPGAVNMAIGAAFGSEFVPFSTFMLDRPTAQPNGLRRV